MIEKSQQGAHREASEHQILFSAGEVRSIAELVIERAIISAVTRVTTSRTDIAASGGGEICRGSMLCRRKLVITHKFSRYEVEDYLPDK